MRIMLIACILSVAATVSATELTLEALLDLDDAPSMVVYKQVDDFDLRLQIYEPSQQPAVPAPALVMIHGGGWENPGPANTAHICRYFALRGMVAINLEYRLVDRTTTRRIPDAMADCRDALLYLREHADALGIDPNQIVVGGDSAGGHLAATLGMGIAPPGLGEAAPMPAATVLYNPCIDLLGLSWMKGHAGIAPLPGQDAVGEWEERARPISPAQQIREGLPPGLVIHGSEDGVVPMAQIEAFARGMKTHKNAVTLRKQAGWGHAFIVPGYGKSDQIVEALRLTDSFLAKLGVIEGDPIIAARWRPPEYHNLFTAQEALEPNVLARSFTFEDYPFLDGQWQGIITDSDDDTWFSISSHSGIHHAQVFRYRASVDRVEHIADLGQVVGEVLAEHSDGVPEGKIHSEMFQDGDRILCATTDAHRLHDEVYTGGYWLAIDRHSGAIENLGRSITEDGLLCAGYDSAQKLMYGHTNVRGLLTRFDPATRQEEVLGFPWEGSGRDWPRGLCLMFTGDGRVYGGRPPRCSLWEYDPSAGTFRTFRPEQPDPTEITAEGDAKLLKQWEESSLHLSRWDATDGCFYFVRNFDEMLCRFYPPAAAGGEGRIEAVVRLRPQGLEMRYGNRSAACTLVIHDRTVYYTPNTGWGGVTHLVSYGLDSEIFTHHGPIRVEGRRRATEVHSMSVDSTGRLMMVAFIFSVEGIDTIQPYAMRDKYPFHPRFLVVDPDTAFRAAH